MTEFPKVEGFRLEVTPVVVVAFWEFRVSALEVLVLLAVSPAYTAVMLLAATVVKVVLRWPCGSGRCLRGFPCPGW